MSTNHSIFQGFSQKKSQVKSWLKRIIKPKIVDIKGVKIKLPKVASDTVRDVIHRGLYEARELDIVSRKLSHDDVVMEIGTGLGLLSSYCAQKIGSDKVFTFEANPNLEKAIIDNYTLNQVSPSLEMCLVGRQNGVRQFYVGDNFWSSSIFDKPQGAKPISVPVISFNDKVREINPSFLLLDIEGGECELVQYAEFHNIQKMMIEIHDWILSTEQIDFVQQTLIEKGFSMVEKSGEGEYYFERQ